MITVIFSARLVQQCGAVYLVCCFSVSLVMTRVALRRSPGVTRTRFLFRRVLLLYACLPYAVHALNIFVVKKFSGYNTRQQRHTTTPTHKRYKRTSKRCLDCRRRRKTFSTVPWGSCSRLIAGKRPPLDSSDSAALFFFLFTFTCLCTLRARFVVFLECAWKFT